MRVDMNNNKNKKQYTILVTQQEELACKYLLNNIRGHGSLEPQKKWISSKKNKIPYCIRCNDTEIQGIKTLLRELREF